jgi:hypothetical protein
MKCIITNIRLALALLSLIAVLGSCNKGPNIKVYTYPAPEPADFNAKSGYPGTDVTITGKNFGTYANAVKVFFNGIKADTVRSCTDGQIVVKTPLNGSTGKITLQVWTNSVDLNGVYTYITPPAIKTVSANAGAPGDIITIKGTGFGTDLSKLKVSFNGTLSTINTAADTSINVTVPSGFTSGNIIVTVNGYPLTGPAFAFLTAVPNPVYQLDFENNLSATIGATGANYIQGTASPLTYINGISGKAAYLAGYLATSSGDNNQAISLPQNIAQYNELSISCWVLYDGTGANSNYGTPIFSMGHTRGNNITLAASTGYPDLNQQISSSVVFENVTGFTGYNNFQLKTTKSVVGTAWHHVVMTLSKTALSEKIYVDGTLTSTLTLPAAFDLTVYAQDRSYLGVGCVSSTNEPGMKGGIDKFQIYNSALTANQVYTVYYKK